MTRTIFGRRQVVLRQRARQDAWRRALQEELASRMPGAEQRVAERVEVVSVAQGAGPRFRDPRD